MIENNTYFNVDGLSSYIKRSPGSIRNLVLRHQIPFHKPAGRLLFIKAEIDQWIINSEGIGLDQIQGKNGN